MDYDGIKKRQGFRIIKVAREISVAVIFLIVLLACIPSSNTTSGNDLLKTIGHFIRDHNDVFFTIILCLLFFNGIVRFTQFALRNKIQSDDLSGEEKRQERDATELDKKSDDLRKAVSEYDKELTIADSSTRSAIKQCSTAAYYTLRDVKAAYEKNLANYHQSNGKMYQIAKHTQLANIDEIKELIETYLQLPH